MRSSSISDDGADDSLVAQREFGCGYLRALRFFDAERPFFAAEVPFFAAPFFAPPRNRRAAMTPAAATPAAAAPYAARVPHFRSAPRLRVSFFNLRRMRIFFMA